MSRRPPGRPLEGDRPLDQRLNLRLDASLYDALAVLAIRSSRPVSVYARAILARYVTQKLSAAQPLPHTHS